MGRNCALKIGHQPGGGQMLKSRKIALFVIVSWVFTLDVWNHLSTPQGPQTRTLSKLYPHFVQELSLKAWQLLF